MGKVPVESRENLNQNLGGERGAFFGKKKKKRPRTVNQKGNTRRMGGKKKRRVRNRGKKFGRSLNKGPFGATNCGTNYEKKSKMKGVLGCWIRGSIMADQGAWTKKDEQKHGTRQGRPIKMTLVCRSEQGGQKGCHRTGDETGFLRTKMRCFAPGQRGAEKTANYSLHRGGVEKG